MLMGGYSHIDVNMDLSDNGKVFWKDRSKQRGRVAREFHVR